MANRVIKDSIWHSDKLAECSIEAQLHYPRLYLLIDDWGCFEVDIYRIKGTVYPKIIINTDQIEAFLKEFEVHGLLFIWQKNSKKYGYFTGKEEGRLPSLSRRHKRHTPIPPKKELKAYLNKFNDLRHLPTKDYEKDSKDYKDIQNGFPNPNPNLNPNPNPNPNLNPKYNDHQNDPLLEEFSQFWNMYGLKIKKQDSFDAYKTVRKKFSMEEIAKATHGYLDFLKAKRIEKNFKQEKMYPTTFLRKERWRDYLDFEYKPRL